MILYTKVAIELEREAKMKPFVAKFGRAIPTEGAGHLLAHYDVERESLVVANSVRAIESVGYAPTLTGSTITRTDGDPTGDEASDRYFMGLTNMRPFIIKYAVPIGQDPSHTNSEYDTRSELRRFGESPIIEDRGQVLALTGSMVTMANSDPTRDEATDR